MDNTIEKLLKRRGLKVTKSRMAILEKIASFDTAIAQSALYQQLKKIDRITLYRTINLLLEQKIIHKASVIGNDSYYALCDKNCTENRHNHQHIHLRCTNCEKVSCTDFDVHVDTSKLNFTATNINVEITGICKKCTSAA